MQSGQCRISAILRRNQVLHRIKNKEQREKLRVRGAHAVLRLGGNVLANARLLRKKRKELENAREAILRKHFRSDFE